MSIQQGINTKVKAALREVSPTCGDCSGFECEILIAGNKKVCGKLEKIVSSTICQQYTPNVKDVTQVPQTQLSALADLVNKFPPEATRALGILMFNEGKTRAQGMRFMQKVFIRYRGAANRNYISNFMSAYVLYATDDRYKLISEDGRCVLTYGEHCRPVIFTEAEFEKIYTQMKQKGNMVDPDVEQLINRRFRAEEEHELDIVDESRNGEIATIDSVFAGNDIKKGRKKGLPDLISLVADAAVGFEVKSAAKTYSRSVKRDRGGDDEPKAKKVRRGGDRVIDVSGGSI